MTPDYPPTTNTTMVINNINRSVRHTLVVSTPWVHPRENCAKLLYVQNVRLFSILWFCILLTSFLLFILLTACGECSCCCKLLKSCRNVTLHKPKLLKRENLVQGHRLCWQSYYTKENNEWSNIDEYQLTHNVTSTESLLYTANTLNHPQFML